MRIDTASFQFHNLSASKKPRYVVRIYFDNANTDFVEFTSHPNTETSPGATVISDVVRGISGVSQKINPDQGNSTIGGFSFKLIDKDNAITEKLQEKLNAGDGLRRKRVQCFVGYEDLLFSDYNLILTYIIDNDLSYIDGAYDFKCLDIQRAIRKDIFNPELTNLKSSVTSYAGHIPATLSDTTKFPTILHDSSYTDRPNVSAGYVRVEDEVIAHEGLYTHPIDGPSFKVFAATEGTHDGSGNAAVLGDSTASFTVDEFVDLYIENFTDNSIGLIISNTATTITATLEGGTDNDWDGSDVYRILTGRGSLNTKAVEHVVDSATSTDRRLKITEHIFLAGAAPKIAYQVLTGHVAENLLIQSEDFTSWDKISIAIVTDVGTSPDGATTADRLDVTVADTHHDVSQLITTTPDTDYTVSVFVKNDGERYANITYFQSNTNYVTAVFDLTSQQVTYTTSETSTIGNYGIVDYGDWSRIYITADLGNFTSTRIVIGAAGSPTPTYITGTPSFLAVAGEDLLIWGAQVSQTNYFVPYFATTTTAQSKETLPDNWHLGIDHNLVRLEDYTRLDQDVWNQFTDNGRHVRFEGHKKTDGKKFIETQIMFWLAAFMPVYSDGQIGVKRLEPILSDSSYIQKLDESNIVKYGSLSHDFKSVINQIFVDWNYQFQRDDYTKTSVLIDADSINKHNSAPIKKLKLRGVNTSSHTDEDLLSYFDSMRDRYSGPPLRLSLNVLPSLNTLEVGDVVSVELDQIRDFNAASGTTLSRAFEIQQVSTNWITGDVKLSLFGSSQKAGTLVRSSLSAVLDDSFYGYAATHDGSSNVAVLSDSTATWEINELIGLNIFNITDGSESVITANTSTTVTGILSGGTDNDWDNTDEYSIGEGIDIRTALTISANSVTANGSLTGGDTMAEGIYYYDGNLTIDADKIVTISKNVELRIKGHLTINGKIDGKGNGHAGGAGATLWSNGSTVFTLPYRTHIPHNAGIGINGFIGNTRPNGDQPSSGILEFGFYPANPVITSKSSVGYFSIVNKSTEIIGAPTNLIGSSGSGGGVMSTSQNLTRTIRIVGTDGGNSGAGLSVVNRGMSFGVNGLIDISGDDGITNNGTYKVNSIVKNGSSGAGGSSGAIVILIDGNNTAPALSTFLEANHGDSPYRGDRLSPNSFETLSKNSSMVGFPAYSMGKSAYSLQYLPESVAIEEEVTPPPPTVINFSAGNDGLYALLSWDALLNSDVVKYKIRLGTTWATGTDLGTTDSTTFKYLMTEAIDYDFMIKAINSDGQESENKASSPTLAGVPNVSGDSNLIGADDIHNDTYYYKAVFESADGYEMGNSLSSIQKSPNAIIVYAGNTRKAAGTLIKDFSMRRPMNIKASFVIASGTGQHLYRTLNSVSTSIAMSVVFQKMGLAMIWNNSTSKIDLYAYSYDKSGGPASIAASLITSINDTGIEVICDIVKRTTGFTVSVVIAGITYTSSDVGFSGGILFYLTSPMDLWVEEEVLGTDLAKLTVTEYKIAIK